MKKIQLLAEELVPTFSKLILEAHNPVYFQTDLPFVQVQLEKNRKSVLQKNKEHECLVKVFH